MNKIFTIITERIKENVILYICISAIGFIGARQGLKLLESFSIGKLLQAMVFIALFFVPIVLLKSTNFRFFLFNLAEAKAVLRSIWMMPVICLGIIIAPILLWLGSNISITYTLFGLACLISFVSSIFLCFKNKITQAVVLMLLTFPFVKFIEYNFQGTFIERIELAYITLTPRIIWLACILFAAFLNMRKNEIFLRVTKYPLILVFLFVFSTVISCAFSPQPIKSLNGVFLEILCPTMFFLIILMSIKKKDDVYILIWAMIGYLFFTTLQGMYFFYKNYGFLIGEKFFLEQNFVLFNIYRMAVNSIIAVIFLVTLLNRKYLRFKFIILTGIVFFCLVIFLSQTRTAIFASIVSGMLYVVLSIKNKERQKNVFRFGVVVICVIVFLNISSDFRFQRIISTISSVTFFQDNDRFTAWCGTINMIRDYPFFGIGYKMWDKYVALYMPQTSWFTLPFPHFGYILNPHNLYLSIAVFFGLPSLILFLLIVVFIFGRCLQILRQNKKNEFGNIAICVFVALLAFLCAGMGGEEHYFTSDNKPSGMFLDFSKGFLFFLLIAITLKINSFCNTEKELTYAKKI